MAAAIARRFQKEGLPIGTLLRTATGAGGTISGDMPTTDLQLKILMEAPAEARECMAVWAKLEHTAPAPLSAAAALETGTLLLPALTTPTDCLDEDLATLRQENEAVLAELDGLAASVASSSQSQSVPLFPAYDAVRGRDQPGTLAAQAAAAAERLNAARQQASVAQSRLQLQALAQELHSSRRFKYKPFEWLYARLDPLLLQSVLEKKQGIPLALSALYSSVALRLGIPLLPQRVPPISTGAAYAASLLQNTRHAGKVNPTEQPSVEPWLLEARPHMEGAAMAVALHLDPSSGSVMTTEECTKAHPTHLEGWKPSKCVHVHVWCNFLRTAMTAYTRSGDGECVAHCMYQLLALDHDAPEWSAVLGKQLGDRQRQ